MMGRNAGTERLANGIGAGDRGSSWFMEEMAEVTMSERERAEV